MLLAGAGLIVWLLLTLSAFAKPSGCLIDGKFADEISREATSRCERVFTDFNAFNHDRNWQIKSHRKDTPSWFAKSHSDASDALFYLHDFTSAYLKRIQELKRSAENSETWLQEKVRWAKDPNSKIVPKGSWGADDPISLAVHPVVTKADREAVANYYASLEKQVHSQAEIISAAIPDWTASDQCTATLLSQFKAVKEDWMKLKNQIVKCLVK